MTSLDELPSTVFEKICENFDDVRDVFNLQLTNSRVYEQVRCTFWGRPRRLRIDDTTNASLFLDSGRVCSAPANRAAVDVLTRRARHLAEFDLSSECLRNETFTMQTIRVLKQNVPRITTLHLNYLNPSVMYTTQRERDAQKPDNRAYPTLKAHKSICELIARHSHHLQLLNIQMNKNGYVSIGRNRTGEELYVQFNCDCDQNIRMLLHPIFNSYTALCRRRPRVLRLAFQFADVELQQLAFNFCCHAFPTQNFFEEIHVQVPNADFVAIFDAGELRADVRTSLSKIVWHIAKPTASNGVETTICEVQLKSRLYSATIDEMILDEIDRTEIADRICDLPRRLTGRRPRFARSLRRLRCAS
ncbi:hypothetical protein M3Y94_01305900 [Aphelenchoides besseyi]|nr:hypothetical protein M3Y94_01305900 [Aphelenchoides besseyi]KAI6220227.1 hypothetical protein M3Y95_01062500 [Aphelenchoides besseyi]